jgi:hypothetical protein
MFGQRTGEIHGITENVEDEDRLGRKIEVTRLDAGDIQHLVD